MNTEPSPTGANGRNGNGRFAPGNRFGRGNPMATKAQRLRVALLDTVEPKDVEDIVAAVIVAAKAGDIAAAAFVLDRTIGKPSQSDVLARIETLEQLLEARHGN